MNAVWPAPEGQLPTPDGPYKLRIASSNCQAAPDRFKQTGQLCGDAATSTYSSRAEHRRRGGSFRGRRIRLRDGFTSIKRGIITVGNGADHQQAVAQRACMLPGEFVSMMFDAVQAGIGRIVVLLRIYSISL